MLIELQTTHPPCSLCPLWLNNFADFATQHGDAASRLRSGTPSFIQASLAEWAVMNNPWLSSQQAECNTSNICQQEVCRRHRDTLDYRHPYDSMRRYAELLALKYQKMKGNEP
jgi:hypothetical protein